MTIAEHIKKHQPYMLAVIMRIYCLGPYKGWEPPVKVEEEPNPFYDRLMREVPGYYLDERLPR